ncbi:MFS transporter [Amycolatopsis acidiphila]|nr:MFS transporter [Amycolatopsis acidiphila]UIJ59195.1 MFS transporter [Amycolatopsis acidiphila]
MIDKTGAGVIAADGGFLSALHLHGKESLIGFLTTATLLFYGASMPVWGILIDKFGAKRCAVTGLVFWAVSTTIAALAPNYGVLVVGRALLGVSEGFLWPLSNALTARWFPRSERSRAKSIWIGAINLGFAVAAYLINAAITLTNWRGAFFLLTILALVVCVPVALLLLKDDPTKVRRMTAAERAFIAADSTDVKLTRDQKRSQLLTWPYFIMIIGWIANNIGVYGLASWFPSYLKDVQHVGKSTASAFVALAFVLCIVVSPIVAVWMDRRGRKAIFSVVGFSLAAVLLVLCRVIPSADFQLAAVIIAIVGIEGMTTLAGQGVLHSMAPERRMGRAAGVMIGVGNFVGAFGATVMGAFIHAGGYPAAFGFLIGTFAVGAACAFSLHRLRY